MWARATESYCPPILEETTMRTPAATILALLLLTPASHADDLADCSQRADVQRTIDGCTRALDRGVLSDRLAAMVLNNRANAYGAMAAYDLAIADYDQAIAIEPTYTHGYFNRGATHLEAGRLESAISDFNEALQIDPGLVAAFVNRGRAKLQSGLLDQAIDDFTAALALEPQSAISHNNRGVAFRRKGQIDRAVADFEAALKLDPTYGTALNNRNEALNAQPRSESLEIDQQRRVSSDSPIESVRRNLLLVPDVK
jgi:tetratricopeptide (TPR) repeat protein